tara:strand:- start:955 stop:2157 length:1203 start_codon:yes stop_codon:yes gene_type:complete
MAYRKFGGQDLIYNTLVTKPEYSFLIYSGSVYKNNDIVLDGDFTNKVTHVSNGEISLHEININRPSDSLVYSYIEKDTTRYANRTISTSQFDDQTQFAYGSQVTQSYPMKAGITRIFVPTGAQFSNHGFDNIGSATTAPANKKYIRSLRNVIESRKALGKNFTYDNLGTKEVNILCIPGIFYGSQIDKKSIELNYYVTGTLVGQLKDVNGDGILVETTGSQVGEVAGLAIYEQGLMLLTGSWDISGGSYSDKFFSSSPTEMTWKSFGTGMPVVGTAINSGSVVNSSCEVKFKGTNKIPTLTMLAFAEKGMYNFSANPSFMHTSSVSALSSSIFYSEKKRTIKNITTSDYVNFDAPFKSTTYISKVGIYDENKNLIAIAKLANPIKKTPDRDYMIKMRLDF